MMEWYCSTFHFWSSFGIEKSFYFLLPESEYKLNYPPFLEGGASCSGVRTRPSRGNYRGSTRRRTPWGTAAGHDSPSGWRRRRSGSLARGRRAVIRRRPADHSNVSSLATAGCAGPSFRYHLPLHSRRVRWSCRPPHRSWTALHCRHCRPPGCHQSC
jgi:hypothetical protein